MKPINITVPNTDTEDSLIMNVDYIEPGYDAFTNSPVTNGVKWGELGYSVLNRIEKITNYLWDKVDSTCLFGYNVYLTITLWQVEREMKAKRKAEIKNTAQSYQKSFHRFNGMGSFAGHSTNNEFYNNDPNDRARKMIRCKTNRKISGKKENGQNS